MSQSPSQSYMENVSDVIEQQSQSISPSNVSTVSIPSSFSSFSPSTSSLSASFHSIPPNSSNSSQLSNTKLGDLTSHITNIIDTSNVIETKEEPNNVVTPSQSTHHTYITPGQGLKSLLSNAFDSATAPQHSPNDKPSHDVNYNTRLETIIDEPRHNIHNNTNHLKISQAPTQAQTAQFIPLFKPTALFENINHQPSTFHEDDEDQFNEQDQENHNPNTNDHNSSSGLPFLSQRPHFTISKLDDITKDAPMVPPIQPQLGSFTNPTQPVLLINQTTTQTAPGKTICDVVRCNDLPKFKELLDMDMLQLKELISDVQNRIIEQRIITYQQNPPKIPSQHSISQQETLFIRSSIPKSLDFNSIRNSISLFVVDNEGNNCLHWVVLHGALDFFYTLLHHLNAPLFYPFLLYLLNTKNTKGETPLQWAVFKGNLFFVQILITYGAIPFIRTYTNSTLFHNTARKGDILLLEFFYTMYLDQGFKDGVHERGVCDFQMVNKSKRSKRGKNNKNGAKKLKKYPKNCKKNLSTEEDYILPATHLNSFINDSSANENDDEDEEDMNISLQHNGERGLDVIGYLRDRLIQQSQKLHTNLPINTSSSTSPSPLSNHSPRQCDDDNFNTFNILQPLHSLSYDEWVKEYWKNCTEEQQNGSSSVRSNINDNCKNNLSHSLPPIYPQTPFTSLIIPNSRFPSAVLLDHMTNKYKPLNPIPYLHHYCTLDDITSFNLNSPDQNGKTPLHWASYNSHFFAVQWLLKYNANVYAQDNERCYALHWAVMGGHSDCINTLTEHLSTLNANDIIMLMEESTLMRRRYGLVYQDVLNEQQKMANYNNRNGQNGQNGQNNIQNVNHPNPSLTNTSSLTSLSSTSSSPSRNIQSDPQDEGELNIILKLSGLSNKQRLKDWQGGKNYIQQLKSTLFSFFGIDSNSSSEKLGLLQFKHLDYTGLDCFQLVIDKLDKLHAKNGTTRPNLKPSLDDHDSDEDSDGPTNEVDIPGYNPKIKADIENYTKIFRAMRVKYHLYEGKDELFGLKQVAQRLSNSFINNAFVLLTVFIYIYGPYCLYNNVTPVVQHIQFFNVMIYLLWFVLPISIYCWFRAAFCNGGLISPDPTLDTSDRNTANLYMMGCSDLNQFGLNEHNFLTSHWILYLKTIDMNEKIRDEIELARYNRNNGDMNHDNNMMMNLEQDLMINPSEHQKKNNNNNNNPRIKFHRFTNPYLAIISDNNSVNIDNTIKKYQYNDIDKTDIDNLDSHHLNINLHPHSPITLFPSTYTKHNHNSPRGEYKRNVNGFFNCIFNTSAPKFHSLFFLTPHTYNSEKNLDNIPPSNPLFHQVYDDQCFIDIRNKVSDNQEFSYEDDIQLNDDLDDLNGNNTFTKFKKSIQMKSSHLDDFLNDTSSSSHTLQNNDNYDIKFNNTDFPHGYPFQGEYRIPMLLSEGLGRGQYTLPQTLFPLTTSLDTLQSLSTDTISPQSASQIIKPRFYTPQQIDVYMNNIRQSLTQPSLRESYFTTIQRFVQLSQLYTNPTTLLTKLDDVDGTKDNNQKEPAVPNHNNHLPLNIDITTMSRTITPSQSIASHFTRMLSSSICLTCGIERPIRSKHCREINSCVHRFDHFCPFLNNVVGAKNYKWFIFWLISVLILITNFIILCIITLKSFIILDIEIITLQLKQLLIEQYGGENTITNLTNILSNHAEPFAPIFIPSTFNYPPSLIYTVHNLSIEELYQFSMTTWYNKIIIISQDLTFIVMVFFILLCVGVIAIAYNLLSYHIQLILSNLTTNEFVNKDRYGYLLLSNELPYQAHNEDEKDNDKNKKINGQPNEQVFINPFGYNLTTNLKYFFGLNRYDPWVSGLINVMWEDIFYDGFLRLFKFF